MLPYSEKRSRSESKHCFDSFERPAAVLLGRTRRGVRLLILKRAVRKGGLFLFFSAMQAIWVPWLMA